MFEEKIDATPEVEVENAILQKLKERTLQEPLTAEEISLYRDCLSRRENTISEDVTAIRQSLLEIYPDIDEEIIGTFLKEFSLERIFVLHEDVYIALPKQNGRFDIL